VTNVAEGAESTSLKAGRHAFQAICDEFQPKVYRYLTRLVGATEAEDLAQEARSGRSA
jgi:DNA-directed RNA polymerase specialized sigma24 family protein